MLNRRAPITLFHPRFNSSLGTDSQQDEASPRHMLPAGQLGR
jgi:hypothetical protein